MNVAALSLTLSLSRWEREQPLTTSINFAAVEQKSAVDSPRSWKQFSLSQRERVGVRENAPKLQISFHNISTLDRFPNSIGDRRDAGPTT